MSEELIANIANAFKPVLLPADSPFYVDLKAVRADQEMGKKIGVLHNSEYSYI